MSRLTCVSSFDSSMSRKLAPMPRMPTGTLTKKIQFQDRCSVSNPPVSGPIASASAEMPAQMPIAVPRCRGGKVAVMMESVAGLISAAPRPCTTRARISSSPLPASPHQSEAAVNTAIPITNSRRRP